MTQTSPLRQRMIEELTICNLSPETQRPYVHHVSKFSRFLADRLISLDMKRFAPIRRIGWAGGSP